MENTELRTVRERELHPVNGLFMLFVLIAALVVFLLLLIFADGQTKTFPGSVVVPICIIGWIITPILFFGLKLVRPNEARILLLFGRYYGTIKSAGLFYVNPFTSSFSGTVKQPHNNISLKTQTLDNGVQKVNDVLGNPIIIGAIVIWRVVDPTQAALSVENFHDYLKIQTDSTIRNIARLYPYDVFSEEDKDEDVHEKTLRGSSQEIAQSMQAELQKRVAGAGLEIDEVRITHLAYAEEIAAAMLQRQQAVAIIAARQKIVDGAVGMVKMALDKLSEDGIVILDEERKAQMVSNLLVVLCGNHDTQPIINTGSIY